MSKEKLWDRAFAKPPPVLSRDDWAMSPEAHEYVYLPNALSQQGDAAEDYYSNGLYTGIMLGAYQRMCRKVGINPVVKLSNGVSKDVLSMTPMDGVQTGKTGERAARLANSRLADCDDSLYMREFLAELPIEREDDASEKQARLTVLSKLELILAGKSTHVSNRLFVQRFLEGLNEHHDALQNLFGNSLGKVLSNISLILNAMVDEGMILASAETEDIFMHRIYSFTAGKGDIVNIYREAGRYG